MVFPKIPHPDEKHGDDLTLWVVKRRRFLHFQGDNEGANGWSCDLGISFRGGLFGQGATSKNWSKEKEMMNL